MYKSSKYFSICYLIVSLLIAFYILIEFSTTRVYFGLFNDMYSTSINWIGIATGLGIAFQGGVIFFLLSLLAEIAYGKSVNLATKNIESNELKITDENINKTTETVVV